MRYFQTFHINPGPEIPSPVFMASLFGRLHKALASQNEKTVGVSFPDQKKNLGKRLRLHGSLKALQKLQRMQWWGPLAFQLFADCIMPVPDPVMGYRTVRRKHYRNNADSSRRRYARRHDMSFEEAALIIPDRSEERNLPWMRLWSESTKRPFNLYVELGEMRQNPCQGVFSHYGLSDTATIPWFD